MQQPCCSGILFREWQSNPRLAGMNDLFSLPVYEHGFKDPKKPCHLCPGTTSSKLQTPVHSNFFLVITAWHGLFLIGGNMVLHSGLVTLS